jgi:hypothetical protein
MATGISEAHPPAPFVFDRSWRHQWPTIVSDGQSLVPRFWQANPALHQWAPAFVDGIAAWGWVPGNPEPQPRPLWLEVEAQHALSDLSRDRQAVQPAADRGEYPVRGDDRQSLSTATPRTLRDLRREWI